MSLFASRRLPDEDLHGLEEWGNCLNDSLDDGYTTKNEALAKVPRFLVS